MSKYDHHDKETLIRLLERRDAQRLRWGVSHEVEEALVKHADYGEVFRVGRERGQRDFIHLRKLGERLESAGAFDIGRMRW